MHFFGCLRANAELSYKKNWESLRAPNYYIEYGIYYSQPGF